MTTRLSLMFGWLLMVSVCEAQPQPGAPPVPVQPDLSQSRQWTIQRIGENHWRLSGAVEIDRETFQLYADEVDLFTATNRLIATGNVVFNSGESRIAADRADFNTETQLGTFYNAAGTASLGNRVDRSMFGTQEPDAYFYGQTIEKLGDDKYRITRGGFTTCVQPTPRWEITSSSVLLNLDHYAILKNSILKVKGVPLMYLPVFYYPIQEDDRATGFLIPVYGSSTFRGQAISNAFFWAINRNQDATFFHDWFSQAGQGRGGEYRYVQGPGSEGSVRTYQLNEPERVFPSTTGGVTTETTQPARQSFEFRGSANQRLPAGLQARARADFFSDITVRQTFQQNVYDFSQRSRTFGGNLSGSWGPHNVSGLIDWREIFFGETSSTLYGSLPRLSFSRAQQQIAGVPVYFSVSSEFVKLVQESRNDGQTLRDQGLARFDLQPTLRAPLSRWQWLTVNSSLSWRHTYYSESLDNRGRQVPEPLTRRYFSLRSDIVGPVFTRVWDTPGGRYAERLKHVIEPSVSLERITPIDNRNQIVALESADFVVGDSTRINYGLTNRFLARRQERGSARAREFVTVSINQTYYTDPRASQFDTGFSTSFRGRAPSNFSPVSLSVRTAPTDALDGDFRLEYDVQAGEIQSISATGGYRGDLIQASGGYSQRLLGRGFALDNFLHTNTSIRALEGRVGGTYTFNYDIGRETLLQQRIMGYYNAQCCGFGIDFQTYNFPQFDPRFPIPQDRRFNFTVTLAGIGSFSNFFAGQQDTRGGFR